MKEVIAGNNLNAKSNGSDISVDLAHLQKDLLRVARATKCHFFQVASGLSVVIIGIPNAVLKDVLVVPHHVDDLLIAKEIAKLSLMVVSGSLSDLDHPFVGKLILNDLLQVLLIIEDILNDFLLEIQD